tara:strand:+ start:45621 stop:47231 length:1611 start_codon:yes stop_codon:yes gene_type:complete
MPKKTDEAQAAFYGCATDDFNHELLALMRSRHPLTFIASNEEPRLISHLQNMVNGFDYEAICWTASQGFLCWRGKPLEGQSKRPEAVLKSFLEHAKARSEDKKNPIRHGLILILPDFHRFLGRDSTPEIERYLKDIIDLDVNAMVIMFGNSYATTPTLDQSFVVLDFPFPNESEIDAILDKCLASENVQSRFPELEGHVNANREAIRASVHGLTLDEASTAFHKSLVTAAHVKTQPLDPVDLMKEKRNLIRKSGLLDYIEPKVSLDDVGGLDPFVTWMRNRRVLFTDRARDAGLPVPKGVMLLGVPGGGKSLSAKATAKSFGLPLLRLDFGRMFGSLVGQSEQQMRNAIRLAETLSPCVLWIDEIEKGLAGANSTTSGDSGTTKRVLSSFLTWLNEKTAQVFVIATANNTEQIPPEFMRAGRFDEIWFIDLPNQTARAQIASILLKKRGIDIDDQKVSKALSSDKFDGFSGAEIEKAIDEARFAAFMQNGATTITLKDIEAEAVKFKPLAKTRPEEFAKMRSWAEERCRVANTITN